MAGRGHRLRKKRSIPATNVSSQTFLHLLSYLLAQERVYGSGGDRGKLNAFTSNDIREPTASTSQSRIFRRMDLADPSGRGGGHAVFYRLRPACPRQQRFLQTLGRQSDQ